MKYLVFHMLLSLVSVVAYGESIQESFNKGTKLINQWRYNEALDVVNTLKSKAPDRDESKLLEAIYHFHQGNYQDSIALLNQIPSGEWDQYVNSVLSLATESNKVTASFSNAPSANGHFMINFDATKDSVLVEWAGDVLETMHEAMADDLGFVAGKPIRVEFLPKSVDLAGLSPLTKTDIKTTGTIALCKYNKLMAVTPRATYFGYPWMETLAHEYVHFAVSKLTKNKAPVWLQEGLARFFQSRWQEKTEHRLRNHDKALLKKALDDNELITFDAMHPSMAKLPSQEAGQLAYAEVLTMISYLHKKKGLAGLRSMLARHDDHHDARQWVAAEYGAPWPTIERNWKRHLKNVVKNDRNAEFNPSEGDTIEFTDSPKPKESDAPRYAHLKNPKARKHARLGGILRARGHDESAALQYEKALRHMQKIDTTIAEKLSRTYLDLTRHEDAFRLSYPQLKRDGLKASVALTAGLSAMALEKWQEAKRGLLKALESSPFDPKVRCGLAKTFEILKDSRYSREEKACSTLKR